MSLTKYLCSIVLAAYIAVVAPAEAKTPPKNPMIHKTTESSYSPLMLFPFKVSPEIRNNRSELKDSCEKYFSLLKQELSERYDLSVSPPSKDMEKAEIFMGALMGGSCSWDEDYVPPKFKVEMIYYDGRRGIEEKFKSSGEYRNPESLEDLAKKMAEKIVVEVVTTKNEPMVIPLSSPWKFWEFRDYYPRSIPLISSGSPTTSVTTSEISTPHKYETHPVRRNYSGKGIIVGFGGGWGVKKYLEDTNEGSFNPAASSLVLGYRRDINPRIGLSVESHSDFFVEVLPIVETTTVNLSYYVPLEQNSSSRWLFEAGAGGTFTNRYFSLEHLELSAQPAFSVALGVDNVSADGGFQFKFRGMYSPNHDLKESPKSDMIRPTNFSNLMFVTAYFF